MDTDEISTSPTRSARRRGDPPDSRRTSSGDDAQLAELGGRLRTYRSMRQLTLKQVASSAGITESYLSQIERGGATGSVDALSRIATALGLTLSDLFSPDPPSHTPLRRADRPMIESSGAVNYLFTTHPLRRFEVMDAILEPGATIVAAEHTHGDSQELLVVLDGTVRCTISGAEYELAQDDSIEYVSSVPHSVANSGTLPARILYVISPPSI